MNFTSEKLLKWWTQDQTCNFLTSILNQKLSLLMPSTSDNILPQDHFTISNFVSASVMIQLTSIVIKRSKVIKKTQKYPLHAIPQNPVHIRSKKIAQLYHFYCLWTWIIILLQITHILYLYDHYYRISVHHPRCKRHQKNLPHVTLPRRTTLHGIHLDAIVHKILPIKPAIWLLLHLLHSYIINTQTKKPEIQP